MLVGNGIFLALSEFVKFPVIKESVEPGSIMVRASQEQPLVSSKTWHDQINAVLSGIVTVSVVCGVTYAVIIVGWVGYDS